jgi:hypothetical protein
MVADRNPNRLLCLEEPQIAADGQSLWLKIVTEARALDIAIPFGELGDVVQLLVHCAAYALSHSDQATDEKPSGMQQREWAPIQALGFGLGSGRTPDESILMVQLSCCQLAFPIAGNELLRLADDFSRMARTLSAGRSKPN